MENYANSCSVPAPWGALFDLDGVLLDSEGHYTEFWHDLNEIYPTGVDRFEYVIKGNTITAILDRYFPDPAVQADIMTRLRADEQSMHFRLFPGVTAFIRTLRANGARVAIVTSSNARKMQRLFDELTELAELTDALITDADVTRSKPHPEGYLLAAERLGVGRRTVVFEDSIAGLHAGRAAGARVVGIATTNPLSAVAPLADIALNRPEELAGVAEQIVEWFSAQP